MRYSRLKFRKRHEKRIGFCCFRTRELSDPTRRIDIWVNLINPFTAPLFEVSTSPSGFFSSDHDVIVSVPKTSDIPDIGPRSYRLIETTSQGELDELVCSWTIAYRIGERSYTRSFGAGKALQTTRWRDEIPILGKPGLLAHG